MGFAIVAIVVVVIFNMTREKKKDKTHVPNSVWGVLVKSILKMFGL